MNSLAGKRILLVISGGVAAYKSLELIRLIRKEGGAVRCILTSGGEKFITALSVASISGEKVYTDLWSLTDESEMGHIRLSREAGLVVVAPASADLIGKMAHGLAGDLASTALLASDKPVMICPAMNPEMWAKAAVQDNIALLRRRGVMVCGPEAGETACGETGLGRMTEPSEIINAVQAFFAGALPPTQPPPLQGGGDSFFTSSPLPRGEVSGERRTEGSKNGRTREGLTALVTSGPTYEPIDPVRFIGNRSSGKQGHAIAAALAHAGVKVTLVTGPVALPDPPGVKTIHVETAQEMLADCLAALPADIAVCAAAVADWAPREAQAHKVKKREDQSPPAITLRENPDILATLCRHERRPRLVVGFAAETENLLENARAKRARKGCDWILANDVGAEKVFGADENHVYLVTERETEDWGRAQKKDIAGKLAARIKEHFHDDPDQEADQ